MQALHVPLGPGGQPDFGYFWNEAHEYLGQLASVELRAYFTKMRLTNQVLGHMKEHGHTLQAVAQHLGKPTHVLATWLGPYHQFTLPQISELESYLGAAMLLAPLGPMAFPKAELEPAF